jgi:hypothetical protein
MSPLTPQQLRKQAHYYRKAATALDAAADMMERVMAQSDMPPIEEVKKEGGKGISREVLDACFTSMEPSRLPSRPQNSLRMLKRFLLDSGPTRRAEIAAKTGIPMGTLSGILSASNRFRRDDEGKWSFVGGVEEVK